MMRTQRRGAAPAAILFSALLMTGCAQGTGGQATDADYDASSAVSGGLRVTGFGLGDEVAQARMDLTEKELGDVEVSLTEGDLDIQQFLSSIAAGDPPDVIYVNRDQVGSLASRGAIISLDDCIAGEDIDTDAYKPSALAQVTFDDAVYGIPEFNQVEITMANKSLLDSAGLGLDAVDGSDWDALAAATTTLAKSSGGSVDVIGYDSKLPDFLPLWAKANGADLLSADGKTASLNGPKVVEALEYAAGLYADQGGFSAIKSARDAADFFGAGNQYASATLGAMPMEQWYLNVLNDVSPDAPMAFTTFKTRDGQPIAFTGGSAWAIPAGSGNAEAACRFAKTMTGTDAWLAAADARLSARDADGKPFTGLLTGNDDADEQIKAMITGTGTIWDAGVAAMYEANDNAFTLPANPADNEFKQAYIDAANRVLNGQATAQESLDQAQSEAQKALDSAWAARQGE